MLCCTSKLAHCITKRHLEACFFTVSWNFPVTQLWEQVGAQRASGPSMNRTRVRGCLCGGSVCVGLVFRRCLRQNVRNSTLSQLWGTHIYENCRGKGSGMVGVQTAVYLRCAANQRNVVRQSNYDLKAINGAGNDLIRLENKRKSGNADLTRLEKSDSSRDFFSCLDSDSGRNDFLEFF